MLVFNYGRKYLEILFIEIEFQKINEILIILDRF